MTRTEYIAPWSPITQTRNNDSDAVTLALLLATEADSE